MRSFNTEPTDTDTDGHTWNSFSEGVFRGFSRFRGAGGVPMPIPIPNTSSEWFLVVIVIAVLGGAFFEPQVRIDGINWTELNLTNGSPCVSVFIVIVVLKFFLFCSFCLSIKFKCAIKIGTARGRATTTTTA